MIADRFVKIVEIIKSHRIDGLLLNSEPNVSYASGFVSPDSYILATINGMTLITDFRYADDFKRKTTTPLTIREYKGNIFKTISRAIREQSLKHVGFESRHLTFAECELLNNLVKKTTQFIPLKETIEPLREIKNDEEISNIRRAIAITLKTYTLIEKKLKPGLTELQIAAEIERLIRYHGAEGSAFKTIVASGPNSSYPHANISQRRIQEGEPIVIDLGVEFNGYKCDLTRTLFLGKITPIVRKVRDIVAQAQACAIRTIKPSRMIKDIDAAARNHIAQEGFGKYFGHALGHGVGLEVHESPSINRKNNHRIQKGMVFTIEPGIYLPGKFGIRIEDMVLVTTNGAEVLSGHHCE